MGSKEKNPFSSQVSSYCSQNKSLIRAKDAPQKPLSCFPLFSCQRDSFLSTSYPPFLPPPPLPMVFAALPSSLQEFCEKNQTPEPHFQNGWFLQENNALILFSSRFHLFCVRFPLLRGTLSLFTLSAANFPPYPSPYLQ